MHTRTFSSSLFQKILTVMMVTAMVMVALPVAPAHAAGEIVVNTTVDEILTNSKCSLREAILVANANNNLTYPDCIYAGPGVDNSDVILLQSGTTYTISRAGANDTNGDLDVGVVAGTSGSLTIQASGTTNAIIDVARINRGIEVGAPGDISLTLDHITIMNGYSPDGAGIFFGGNGTLNLIHSKILNNESTGADICAGGIYNNSLATINITDSTIEGNICSDLTATGDGGGIYKGGGGVLNITNSTFANNSAPHMGGGLRIDMPNATPGTPNVTITNSTFANNTAGARGGGIQVKAGEVAIFYSTFSGNTANSATTSTGGAIQADGDAITGIAGTVKIYESILANSFTNGGVGKDCDQIAPGSVVFTNSLVENNNDCTGTIKTNKDPNLAPLADNGGPTQTMALIGGSPAIDGSTATCTPANDQRGVLRPQGGKCDLGSYEAVPDTIAPTVADVSSSVPNGTYAVGAVIPITVTFSEPVVVTGTPRLTLKTGSVNEVVDYSSGNGTSTLIFSYTVQTGDSSSDLDYVSSSSLALNGGTIKDPWGNNAVLTLPAPGAAHSLGANKNIAVDGTAPILLSFTRQNPTVSLTSADVLVFRATFNEPVTQVDVVDFLVGGLAPLTTATVTNVNAANTSTYDVTVSGGNLATYNGVVGLNLSGLQNIQDLAGNPLTAGEPATDQTFTVNNELIPLPADWVGGVSISSDKNIVSVGRPHIGAEVASYDGFAQGSLSAYVPMLFKKAYG
ncbi:MAG: choice-of-anchor Q domain-containing protein, partial [Bacteroidota bacterium]